MTWNIQHPEVHLSEGGVGVVVVRMVPRPTDGQPISPDPHFLALSIAQAASLDEYWEPRFQP